MSKRKEKRRDKAELLCREVRKQIVKYGFVKDTETTYKLLSDWLKYSIKNSYK